MFEMGLIYGSLFIGSSLHDFICLCHCLLAEDAVAVGTEMEMMRRKIEMLREVIQLMHSSSKIIEQSALHGKCLTSSQNVLL